MMKIETRAFPCGLPSRKPHRSDQPSRKRGHAPPRPRAPPTDGTSLITDEKEHIFARLAKKKGNYFPHFPIFHYLCKRHIYKV